MRVTPNLHFHGQCEEALDTYQKAFGAHPAVLLRYSDADKSDMPYSLTAEELRYVYHAEMNIGQQRFFFSDSLCPLAPGINLSIVVTFDRPEDVMHACTVLMEGGYAITPLKQTTYSSCFTSLVDRYGIRWELMTETGD